MDLIDSATQLHGQGTLAKTDIMQRSPYETISGNKPPLHGFKPFGLPMKIHIPVEKRKMCKDPKLIARSFTGFYLCQDPTAPTKILVQAEDTGNIVSTGFYQPMYSVDSASRIVSNAGLRNTIDLDRITEATLKSQISNNKISSRKSVSAERIFDVSVIEDDNKELLGVVEIKDALAKENIWVTLPVFLAGNVDKVYTHKNMLYEFLNRHFQSRANDFYPIFVQSDIKLATPRDKQTPIKIYPGLIIGTDANSKKGYRVALYETDIGQENICDLHDCPAADIVQFEVAKILAPCFTQDLKYCSNDSAQLRSSHAPDLTQDLNYCSNDSFESGTFTKITRHALCLTQFQEASHKETEDSP